MAHTECDGGGIFSIFFYLHNAEKIFLDKRNGFFYLKKLDFKNGF